MPCRIENPNGANWIEVRLAIDTGADGTILDERLAEYLGLRFEADSILIRGYRGSIRGRTAVVEVVPLAQEDLRIRVEAVFAPDIGDEIGNVPGLDHLTSVDLVLSHANNLVTLGLAS